MKPHKWAKEIIHWANGGEIEIWHRQYGGWGIVTEPRWYDDYEYRIKPQPKESEFSHIPYWLCCGSLDIRHHNSGCCEAKMGHPERCRFGTVKEHQKELQDLQPKEPQYLYVYNTTKGYQFCRKHGAIEVGGVTEVPTLIGKIKLEQDDE